MFFVSGLSISVAEVVLSDPRRRVEIAKKETLDAGAGALGSEAGVGLCMVFGIASGGWGLLACGLVGGVGGSILADHVVYPVHPDAALRELRDDGRTTQHLLLVPPGR